jgi:hypothetical protein
MADSTQEQTVSADLVVGLIPPSHDPAVLAAALARILNLVPPMPSLLVYPPSAENEPELPKPGPQWRLLAEPQLKQDRAALTQGLGDSYRAVYQIARNAGARACAVIASDLSTVTADWPALLLSPIVDEQFDLIAPCYSRHPFEGMINRAILYPLTRALYGKRIRNPLGPDFGVSSAFLQRIAGISLGRFHPVASLTVEAVTNGMKIGQAHLGEHVYPQPDWTDLSSLLSQVLSPVFLDIERYAAHWQRTRGSETIPEFGKPMYTDNGARGVEVAGLIDSFHLGARNLIEVWSFILPPSSLLELRRLTRQDSSRFRMPDETWSRIVYDFALAHRLRTMNRDQMLRAMTPIYLGWVASYALELDTATPDAVEHRLERLCIAYESTKSYFVSRWRWPDRFSP